MASEMDSAGQQPTIPARRIPRPGLDLYIVGGVGEGKSATSNSILGREEFELQEDVTEPIKKYQRASTSVEGRQVNVLELSTERDPDADLNEMMVEPLEVSMMKAMYTFPQGLSALVLVISYADELSLKILETVQQLKRIMGENVIRDFTVCVFTHGERIRQEMEFSEIDLVTWCLTQDDELIDGLFKECCFRCVLFDNCTDYEEVKKVQIQDLISTVDNLTQKHLRYNFNKFQQARKAREDLRIVENFWREMDDVRYDLEKIVTSHDGDSEETLKKIHEIIETSKKELEGSDVKDASVLLSYLEALSSNVTTLEWTLNEVDEMKKEGEEVRERALYLQTSMSQEIKMLSNVEETEDTEAMIARFQKELGSEEHEANTQLDEELATLETEARSLSEVVEDLWQTIHEELGDGTEHADAIRINVINKWQQIMPIAIKNAKDQSELDFIEIVQPFLQATHAVMKKAPPEQLHQVVGNSSSETENTKNSAHERRESSGENLKNEASSTSNGSTQETTGKRSHKIMRNVKTSLVLVCTSVVVGAGNVAYQLLAG